MLARQGGKCAICRKTPRKRYLAVDHDHDTNEVRGLLCFMCNSALGVFEFSEDTARAAAAYLHDIAERHRVRRTLVEPHRPALHDDLPF